MRKENKMENVIFRGIIEFETSSGRKFRFQRGAKAADVRERPARRPWILVRKENKMEARADIVGGEMKGGWE